MFESAFDMVQGNTLSQGYRFIIHGLYVVQIRRMNNIAFLLGFVHLEYYERNTLLQLTCRHGIYSAFISNENEGSSHSKKKPFFKH